MTSTEVRTYAMGDRVPNELRTRSVDDWCRAAISGGYVCSIRRGHTGPQHLAWTPGGGVILAVADRDTSGDEPTTEEVLLTPEQARELSAELDRTRSELRNERATREGLQADHDEFRRQVVEVAMRYARAHDWCEVVQRALGELGLEVKRRYRVHTKVLIERDGWEAGRPDAYVEVEATSPANAWPIVDELRDEDAHEALEQAGVRIPEGWDFVRFDAFTHDVEEV